MGADNFPADIGELDPRLALPADHVLPAHFVHQIDRGDILTNGQDFEAQSPFLGPGGK